MAKEKKIDKIFLKEKFEDNTIFSVNAQNLESDSASEMKGFEQLLKEKIKSTLLESSENEFKTYWNIIEFIGDFLEIQDYDCNLFSVWILKIIAQKIIYFAKQINIADFKCFIYWINQEIKLVNSNKDMSRKEFFELLSKAFYQALSKIFEGKGLLLLIECLRLSEEEETEISSESSIKDDDDLSLVTINEEAKNLDPNSQFDSKIINYENLLYTIVEATYQIFGPDANYKLIQCIQDSDKIFYELPYRFRKPRLINNMEISKKNSISSTSKTEKTKKKRKYSQKTSMDKISEILLSELLMGEVNYEQIATNILPLSEAIESFEYILFTTNE